MNIEDGAPQRMGTAVGVGVKVGVNVGVMVAVGVIVAVAVGVAVGAANGLKTPQLSRTGTSRMQGSSFNSRPGCL
jgi:hypothetical protein